jgi:hypothetical protein
MFNTPILLIIFNRPDKVERLVNSLRATKPTKIYVSADGPRENVPTDITRCKTAREAIKKIDWPCEVITNFHERNTGADFGPEKAINWFFENVEEGIVLEDDCIAHPDFFRFAQEMLSRYKDNHHVMMISGNNFQNGIVRGESSYYFSKYPSTWGWASWKRAWKHYDTNTSAYEHFIKKNTLDDICQSSVEKKYWSRFFEKINSGKLKHWDIKWIFAIWNNNGISITPNVNLVQNVGFGKDATHTFKHDDAMVVKTVELGKITHPSVIEVNKEADKYLFNHIYKFTLAKKFSYLVELTKRKLGL